MTRTELHWCNGGKAYFVFLDVSHLLRPTHIWIPGQNELHMVRMVTGTIRKCECRCWLLFPPHFLDIGLIITVLTMFTWITARKCQHKQNLSEVKFSISMISLPFLMHISMYVLIASVHKCHLNFDSFYYTEPWWTVMLPWQQHFTSLRITPASPCRNETEAKISCVELLPRYFLK